MRELLNLFKAVEIEKSNKILDLSNSKFKNILDKTIHCGFVLAPEVINDRMNKEFGTISIALNSTIEATKQILGLTPEQMNASFHKSWGKIATAPMIQLIIEQTMHYITTYGFEKLGVFSHDSVYLPVEKLEIPELNTDGIRLSVIHGYTRQEIKKKMLDLLNSGIALSQESVNDVIAIIKNIGVVNKLKMSSSINTSSTDILTIDKFTENELMQIKNKEVKSAVFDQFNILPKDPVEFFRYVIYKATGNTLLIKDRTTIDKIELLRMPPKQLGPSAKLNQLMKQFNPVIDEFSGVLKHYATEGKQKATVVSRPISTVDMDSLIANKNIVNLFKQYEIKHGLKDLASIFFRFKPLFLAMKGICIEPKMVNKIRKLAKKYHKPMKEDYLNTVTSRLKNIKDFNGTNAEMKKLNNHLDSANIFRKIRLAYALKYRSIDAESILYKVRNGRGYSTKFEFKNKMLALLALDNVIVSITDDIRKNVNGTTIFIPEYISYTLPATQKQFVCNIPCGSSITVAEDMIFGINWHNGDSNRIDLDLSMLSSRLGKVGWDGDWRSKECDILFSGDVVDAPGKDGATELFYIAKNGNGDHASVYLNNFTYYEEEKNIDIPYRFFIASEKLAKNDFNKKNYMVDPSNIIISMNEKIGDAQQTLGLLDTKPDGSTFYFTNVSIGNSNSVRGTEYVEHAKRYLIDSCINSISLGDILTKSGANVVNERPNSEGSNSEGSNGEKSNGDMEYIDLSPEALEKDTFTKILVKR